MILQITFRNTYKIRISKTIRRINYIKKLRMIIFRFTRNNQIKLIIIKSQKIAGITCQKFFVDPESFKQVKALKFEFFGVWKE
jgi:hypothetical protein